MVNLLSLVLIVKKTCLITGMSAGWSGRALLSILIVMQVVWGKPPRPEWGQALEITPRTVHAMSVTVSLLISFPHSNDAVTSSPLGKFATKTVIFKPISPALRLSRG